MAEYVVPLVVEKLASQLMEEAISLSKGKEHVEWIEAELRRMQCFLKDADAKQDKDARISNWVVDIREVAFDADDFIDTYIYKTNGQREKGLVMCFKRYSHLFFLCELVSNFKINKNISRIKSKIHEIADSKLTYGIENIRQKSEGATLTVSELQERRISSPHHFEDDIIGLDEDIKRLESQLIYGQSCRSVLSIIGMAGLGKTTLAKMIYHSNGIKNNFDCCAWIYVSQEYSAEEVLRDLAKKVMGFSKIELEKMHREDLVEEISKFLQRRRYVIVLDDIWKKQVWDNLKDAFPDSKNGSRIMLTTRFKDIAIHADPRSPPHEPSLLNDEESWQLLSRKISLQWNAVTSLPPWTDELGKKIVKKCGGLPLAIVVLGGLLSRREASYNEWLKVLQSVHWQLRQDTIQCADILALSYFDLPFYLKPCFLYFGLFPEDFEISASRLILLWVAEGFVQPRGQEPIEDVSEDYLEELVGRSMVQVATRNSNGRIKTCRMHDLLRELAIAKATEDRFLHVIHGESRAGSIRTLSRSRRLAIHFNFPPSKKTTINLRSLLCFDLNEPVKVQVKRFKLLRVLDLEGSYISKLDSAIGKLIHLRYLGLRGTWLKNLPRSLRYLSNLETLDLRSTLINPFPDEILRLQQLRHLYFSDVQPMVSIPPTIPSTYLPDLQTLKGLFISEISRSDIEDFLSKLTTMRSLSLHGRLCIKKEHLGNWVAKLKSLECLKLNATRLMTEDTIHAAVPEWDLSCLTHLYKIHLAGSMQKMFDIQYFPTNLSELTLTQSWLMEDPMKTLEKLRSLRVLKLKHAAYVGREITCSSGGFVQLQLLKLSFMNSVETFRIEEGAMPNLRELEIVQCKLKIVPRGLWPVQSLKSVKLGFMPGHDIGLKIQEREGENWYRIEHVLPI
ncbi:putative disease resistance protein At1g50180 [Cannabis sativa]|uniref:putative disease resistance protein At1g50180 n=1 Tax=Cannabis sativa TaxID=3483 RepID=UPI0029CA5C1F|nr:putative disease resistance protein At1g50180 [Cannabis sativa]